MVNPLTQNIHTELKKADTFDCQVMHQNFRPCVTKIFKLSEGNIFTCDAKPKRVHYEDVARVPGESRGHPLLLRPRPLNRSRSRGV